MPSRFDERFAKHAIPMLEKEHGRSVRLIRGALKTDIFTARRDPRDYSSMESAGVGFKQEQAAYLLPIASIVLDGQTEKPHVNDILEEGTLIDGVFTVSDRWTLRAPDDETPAVQKERTVGHDWRVHCEIATHDGAPC